MPEQKFLISDVGGTNIRLAWFQGDPRQRRDEKTFRTNPKTTQPYEILTALKEYADTVNQHFDAACLGMAGQVEYDKVQITNRPDCIYRKDIARVLKLDESRVLLINDMPPHLAGVDLLLPSELLDIRPGKPERNGNRAILMPGTGVGVGGAIAMPHRGYQPFPSEGGHLDFAPRDHQQYQLLQFLRPLAEQQQQGNVSNEFVFAGEGIRRIYAFLQNPTAASLDAVPKSEEITSAVEAGNLPDGDLRQRTIDLYLKILGAAAGNLSLLFAATGGLYLGGSISLTLRRFLSGPIFLDAFLNSGPKTHCQMLESIPVRLIDYKDSGLLGAGVLAKSLLS